MKRTENRPLKDTIFLKMRINRKVITNAVRAKDPRLD